MPFTHPCGHRPLDGYVIKRGISRGGFGEVYFGLSDGGKEVALKCLFRHVDIELRGIRQCLNLKHAHLVHLYDLRHDNQGNPWIVMEYIRGETLHDLLRKHPQGLDHELVRPWFGQLAAGVHSLHEQGIVHRDLKPANVFLENGLVKVGDYGLCKTISGSQHRGQTQNVGTVHYMAPEVGQGNYARSVDIYAAGILLHEMVTGQVPFDGETSAEILLKHLSATPDLTKAGPFAPIIGKALAKDPKVRFGTLAEMARCVTDVGERTRPATLITHPIATMIPEWTPRKSDPPAHTTVILPPARPAAELVKSLAVAGLAALVISMLWAASFLQSDWGKMMPAFFVTVFSTWGILLAGRCYRVPMDDSLVRRLGQGVFGVLVGLFAVWLQGYSLYLNNPASDPIPPRGDMPSRHVFFGSLYADNQTTSVLLGHIAYFGLVFLVLRWWKSAERQRLGRVAVPAILATCFWAFVLLFLLPSAEERLLGFASMVMTSVVVQIASPRCDPENVPEKRRRLRWA